MQKKGFLVHGLFNKRYISIEGDFKKSNINQIIEYINSEKNRPKRFYRYIIMESWLLVEQDGSLAIKPHYKKICKKLKAECIVREARIIDKLASGAINLKHWIFTFWKPYKPLIRHYKFIGKCTIDFAKLLVEDEVTKR